MCIFKTHLTFGQEFTNAVEAKQVAQQDAEKARFLVEKAEQVKKAAVITAEGDSKAAELIAKALIEVGDGLFIFINYSYLQCLRISYFHLNLGLIELRRIETAEEIATQLSQSPNVAYLAENANMLLSALGK